MRRLSLLYRAALLLLCLAAPAQGASALALDVACLREAYPGLIQSVETRADGSIWLRTARGALLYDDGVRKSRAEDLARGDIEDSMRQRYPLEPERPALAPDEEAGRVRSYPLLRALYGARQQDIEGRVVTLRLAGQTLRVAPLLEQPLRRMQASLARLLAGRPALRPYCAPIYSYYWRPIAKTDRLSPHSFGLAIDLNPDLGAYWQWSPLHPHPDQKTYPPELVALFEANGFIWGGKWDHYDLMHFEYRPELILKARRLRDRDAARQTR